MSMGCILIFLLGFYIRKVAISISFAPPQWTKKFKLRRIAQSGTSTTRQMKIFKNILSKGLQLWDQIFFIYGFMDDCTTEKYENRFAIYFDYMQEVCFDNSPINIIIILKMFDYAWLHFKLKYAYRILNQIIIYTSSTFVNVD